MTTDLLRDPGAAPTVHMPTVQLRHRVPPAPPPRVIHALGAALAAAVAATALWLGAVTAAAGHSNPPVFAATPDPLPAPTATSTPNPPPKAAIATAPRRVAPPPVPTTAAPPPATTTPPVTTLSSAPSSSPPVCDPPLQPVGACTEPNTTKGST